MRLPIAVAACLALAGCDHTEDDCRLLVDRLNQAVEHLRPQRVTGEGKPSKMAAQMRRFGATASQEADALAALALRTPPLSAERDAYVEMARSLARAAASWSDALDALAEAQQRGDAAKDGLDANLKALEKRCEGSTCFELMKRLAQADDQPTEALPDALERLADDVAAIESEAEPVNARIAAHARQLRALAEALRAMEGAEREARRAEQELAASSESEGPIVDRINGICRR